MRGSRILRYAAGENAYWMQTFSVSPLAFCGETSQNILGSETWVTPRFGLAPTPLAQKPGRLVSYLVFGGGRIMAFHLVSLAAQCSQR
jgi:hypothetical protein